MSKGGFALLLTGLCLVALPVSTRSVQPEPDRGVWRTAAPARRGRKRCQEPISMKALTPSNPPFDQFRLIANDLGSAPSGHSV